MKGWAKLAVGLTGLVALLAASAWFILQDRRSPAQRSAEDVLVLWTVLRDRRWRAPLYPDWAYQSQAGRDRYGLLPEMPQEVVDQYLAKLDVDHSGDSIIKYGTFKDTPYRGYEEHFYRRLNRWRNLWSGAMLTRTDLSIRRKMTPQEIQEWLRKEQTRRRLDLNTFYYRIERETVIPQDPFAGNAPDALYRYGLSPGKIRMRESQDHTTSLFPDLPSIVAGNGPDGDADLDLTRFDAEISTATGRCDPFLGFRSNPVDLIYDPTNGVQSDGDIFLINDYTLGASIGPKALWDEGEFRKRHGL